MANTNLPRIRYQKILYVTDLSEAGRKAFPHAASIAHTYGAELTVFHVLEKRDFEKYLIGYINDDIWEVIKTRNLQEARELLISRKRDDAAIRDDVDQLCQDAMGELEDTAYVTYDVKVETGDAVEEIIKHAHFDDYDLVIIGKQGHGARRGTLMGDTVRRVIRHCKVPVMAVDVSG